jgi:hypothetical protein
MKRLGSQFATATELTKGVPVASACIGPCAVLRMARPETLQREGRMPPAGLFMGVGMVHYGVQATLLSFACVCVATALIIACDKGQAEKEPPPVLLSPSAVVDEASIWRELSSRPIAPSSSDPSSLSSPHRVEGSDAFLSGDGPIFAVLGAERPIIILDKSSAREEGDWYYVKLLWLSEPNYSGPALIRGREIGGLRSLDLRVVRSLRLSSASRPARLASLDPASPAFANCHPTCGCARPAATHCRSMALPSPTRLSCR